MSQPISESDLRFAVLAADTVLFTLRDGKLLVRLIHVDRPPHFVNSRGLPGGLLRPTEEASETSTRTTQEKAHVSGKKIYTEQLYTFSRVDRDRRGRVVAVAYLSLVPWDLLSTTEKEDTKETWWCEVSKARHLAYDHDEILSVAIKRLRSRAAYTTIISKIMPKEFTLTELENAYESITGTKLDKRNFRKKILKLNILKELPKKTKKGAFRPAQLYTFASSKIEEIEVL